MTERPSPERLAEIDEHIAVAHDLYGNNPDDNPLLALAAYDLRAEVEALRAERDGSRDLFARAMGAIHKAAGIRQDGVAGILGWIESQRACDCGKRRALGRCTGNCDRDG